MNGIPNASTDTMFAFLSPKFSTESGDGRASLIAPESLENSEASEIGTFGQDVLQNTFANLVEEIAPAAQETTKSTPHQETPLLDSILMPTNDANALTIPDETPPHFSEPSVTQETVKYAGIKTPPETDFTPPPAISHSLAPHVPFSELPTLPAFENGLPIALPDEIRRDPIQISISNSTIHAIPTKEDELPPVKTHTLLPETSALTSLDTKGIKTPIPANVEEIPQSGAIQQITLPEFAGIPVDNMVTHQNPTPFKTKQHQPLGTQFTPVHTGDTSSFSFNTQVESPQLLLDAKVVEIVAPTSSSISNSSFISTGNSLPPTPSLTSHVAVQQVGDALVRQAEKSGDIIIRLDPAELGKVNITFTFDKAGGVNAHVVAETANTTAILRDRADILNTQLRQSGFENINLSFDTNNSDANNKGFGAQFSNQSQSEHASNRAKIFDIAEQDMQNPLEPIEPLQQRPSRTNGALDLKL